MQIAAVLRYISVPIFDEKQCFFKIQRFAGVALAPNSYLKAPGWPSK